MNLRTIESAIIKLDNAIGAMSHAKSGGHLSPASLEVNIDRVRSAGHTYSRAVGGWAHTTNPADDAVRMLTSMRTRRIQSSNAPIANSAGGVYDILEGMRATLLDKARAYTGYR